MSDPYVGDLGIGIQFPHCDALILHSPGVCEFCDRHADWQQLRIAMGIAFSDTDANTIAQHRLVPCPSTARRPAEVRDLWHGNVPSPPKEDSMPKADNARCDYKGWRGYWCSRERGHIGPCALRPKWWNLPGKMVR